MKTKTTKTKATKLEVTNFKAVKRGLMSIMLILALTLTAVGCGKQKAESPETDAIEQQENTQQSVTDSKIEDEEEQAKEQAEDEAESAGVQVLGEGNTKFVITVCDKDGNETVFEVNTDKKTVGEALLENNLIEGEEGEYGLYIKKVNGIEADFEKDQTYWAFYIDGEYANSGVDTTEIVAGSTYSLKVEK